MLHQVFLGGIKGRDCESKRFAVIKNNVEVLTLLLTCIPAVMRHPLLCPWLIPDIVQKGAFAIVVISSVKSVFCIKKVPKIY